MTKILKNSRRLYLLYLSLFLIAFSINAYYALVVQFNYPEVGNELLYYDLASLHVEYLFRGNFDFGSIPEAAGDSNPPLSKIVLGLFRLAFDYLGVDVFPIPSRLLSTAAIGLTCVYVFAIGHKVKDLSTGLLAYLLLTPSFVLIPYEFWVSGELNGFRISLDWAYGFNRVTDSTCMLFLTLSVYYLLGKDMRISRAAIFYGLASATKYVAIPIIPSFFLLHSLSQDNDLRKTSKKLLTLIVVGVVVFIVGNPLTWSIGRATKTLSTVRGAFEFQTLLSETLWKMITEDFDYYLFRFLIHFIALPVGLFIEVYLVQMFAIILLLQLVGKLPFISEQMSMIEWSSVVFLTLSMIKSIVIGGWIINYYSILLFPPLSIFCSLSLSERLSIFAGGCFSR